MLPLSALPWILLQSFSNVMTYIRRSPYITSIDQPDTIKVFSSKSHLFSARVFRPPGKKVRLPLVVRIHGGGFIMNNPAGDDTLSRFLAHNAECVVISLDYGKSPLRPFPAGYEDLIEQISSAIRAPELGIDGSRVVLCGSSSGGNLALAISQDQRLRGKVLGVLALTPIVDMTQSVEEKLATRPDASVQDFLAGLYNTMRGLYTTPSGVSLSDIRVSPGNFTSREDLPRHLYFISAEHDLLAKETEMMAERVAVGEKGKKQATERGWQAGDVRWDLVKGYKHGFENFPVKDKRLEELRLKEVEVVFGGMAGWLRGIFEGVS